jgi:hypothetical protein
MKFITPIKKTGIPMMCRQSVHRHIGTSVHRFLFSHFLLYILIAFSLTAAAPPMQTVAQEYNLKAAFIYNFTKYITWNGASENTNEFVIGIFGNSPISVPLGEIARTKKVNDKKIIIRYFRTPQDISYCNILFVSRRNIYPLSSVLQQVPSGTLTIAEDDGMAAEGAAFNFVIEENRLKFEANLKAISAAGLKASSELLQHAIIVE